MSVPIPPGVFDILPSDSKEPWCSSYLWTAVEAVMRSTAKDFGYQEIRTPIFERTELFRRGVGETSDIVSKEMYTFIDKGDRSMTLRPEGTAPVIRSFVENQLHRNGPIQKLFYIGPMFRYERSQAGRYRQHHQFGAEAIGNAAPEQDVEMIDLCYTIYKRLGIKHLTLYINSIGDPISRAAFREALQNYLLQYVDRLSADSQNRLKTNPLRILDSKDPQDKEIVSGAPSILDFLNDESRAQFEQVKAMLTKIGIPYQVNPLLVRGLDYYNKTVFEIVAGELGAQNSIAGGGRFDGLIKTLGGPDLPSMGFATGIERIIQTMLKQGIKIAEAPCPTLLMIPLGEKAKEVCFQIVHQLRQEGIAAEGDFTGRKLSKSMQYADQIKVRFVAVVGDAELAEKQVELKEMDTGTKTKAPLFYLSRILQSEVKGDEFLKMWAEMSEPFQDPAEAEFFIQKLAQTIHQTQSLTTKLQKAMEQIKSFLK